MTSKPTNLFAPSRLALAVVSIFAAAGIITPATSALARPQCVPILEWTRSHDGVASRYDYATAVVLDRSGNVIVAGCAQNGSATARTQMTAKYSPAGKLEWTTTRAGAWPMAVATDATGNVYVASCRYAAPMQWLIEKYSPAGFPLWSHTGPEEDGMGGTPTNMAIDSDGDIIVVGWRRRITHSGDTAGLIRKYDAEGKMRWERVYDHPGRNDEMISAVTIDASRNVIVAGSERGIYPGHGQNWLVAKYGPTGDLLWTRTPGAASDSSSTARAVATDIHGNVTVIGERSKNASGTHEQLVIRKYASDGRLLWQRNYGGSAGTISSAEAMAVDGNGNLLLAGLAWPTEHDRSYAWLIHKYDSSGNPVWRQTYSSPARRGDSALAIATGPKGVIVIAGYEDRDDLGQATNWVVRKLRQPKGCR